MNDWMNKSVRLNDSWGPGAADTLSTPLGQQPEFTFRGRHLRDSKGNRVCGHFSIDFSSGYLADGWQGVNLVPMGTDPVAGISGLPPWDPSQRDTYRKMIDAAAGSLGNSRTARLEGVVPYLGTGGVGYNKVRLFYINSAVKSGPSKDLVVVKVSSHIAIPGTVHAKQDGVGHGPP